MYAFGFYKQGNGFSVGIFLAGIPDKTVVWTFNRDNPPVGANATLQFTSEGRLVLRSARGQEIIGDQARAALSASMLNSGNFVLYSSDGDVIWESFDHPTDTLLRGQSLEHGNELVSSASPDDHSSGMFRLKMQDDGHLVQYPVNTPDSSLHAYWSTGPTRFGRNVTLVFDDEARQFLVNSSGAAIYNISATGYSGASLLARIDVDGIFRVHSYTNDVWSVEWSSTDDKCAPKGLCGLNGFCTVSDGEANCKCISGFDFVQKGNWTAGCERISVRYSCGNDSARMDELTNTVWASNAYSNLIVADADSCAQACLTDCNCEAALYKGGYCQKDRLPLKYGHPEDSYMAFIKVYTPLPARSGRKIQKGILIISVFLVSLSFVMMAVSVTVFYCKKKMRCHTRPERPRRNVEFLGEEVALKSFTFKELKRITGEFKEEIGRGSFGTVYRGKIAIGVNEREVAVKKLEKVLEEGDREFHNEVRAIARSHHKNLVQLLGYCREGSNRLLVYEYIVNGSLADVLFKQQSRPSWSERLGMARGIARGILYLHEECESQIIHCDIKPQNILIDHKGVAKISDFGLTKFLMQDQSKTDTGIRGTRGYVAPEWHKRQPVTVKADVYSYGIVLLEIICCRKSVVLDIPVEEAILEDWVYSCYQSGALRKLVGVEEVDMDELEKMIKVALWCTQEDPSLRPMIKSILLMMEGITHTPNPPA